MLILYFYYILGSVYYCGCVFSIICLYIVCLAILILGIVVMACFNIVIYPLLLWPILILFSIHCCYGLF